MGFFGVGAAMGLAALVVTVVGSTEVVDLMGVGGLMLNMSLGSASMA
jgi:hypothetical protein